MSLWLAWAKDRVQSGILKELNVPDYITEIPAGAFMDCEMLESVTFSPNLRVIGEGAFRNCSSLKAVIIPEGVVLKPGAFSDCRGLKCVVLSGENLVNLPSAFDGCIEISSVTVASGEAVIESGEAVVEPGAAVIGTGGPVIESGAAVIGSGEAVIESGGSVVETGAAVIGSGEAIVETGAAELAGFDQFTKLSTIKFLRKVTKVDESVFMNLKNLRTIIMSPNNPVYRPAEGNQWVVERATGRLMFSDYLCRTDKIA